MENCEYAILTEARQGIEELDAIRVSDGISYAKVSRDAGTPDTGQQYYRMMKRKDIRLSRFLGFAKAIGCDVVLIRRGKAE